MSDKAIELEKEIDALKASDVTAPSQPWSPELVTSLSFGILAFCILVLLISAFSLRGKDTEGVVTLKLYGLTLIICFSALLMVTGYGQDQLTPVIGLFGALAGYLLGKEKK